MAFAGTLEDVIRTLRQGTLVSSGYSFLFWEKAIKTDAVIASLPIFAVIPYSNTYVEELKTKYVRFCLVRTSYSHYIFSRIAICFLCGGSVALAGSIMSMFFSLLMFTPFEIAISEGDVVAIQFVFIFTTMFLSGGLWAVVGMSISSFIESKYVAYAAPFVVYYLLVILCERYLPSAFLLYPPNWTNPDAWPYGLLGVTAFLLELTVICSIVFIVRTDSRLREL